jgi:anti-sigma factor RsiW
MKEDVEREEIEKLLPWYVTGRLGLADTSRVESYLRQHPQMLTHLSLMRAEREETKRANEAIWPPTGLADRLMASVSPTRMRLSGRGLLSSFGQFFSKPTARGVRWAAVAAGLVVLAQAAVITTLLMRDGDHTYQVAAGASQGNGVAALIAFSDDAKAQDIAQLLAEFDARIVDGPKPGGLYQIRMRSFEKSRRARDALLNRLAGRREVVRTVLPSRD